MLAPYALSGQPSNSNPASLSVSYHFITLLLYPNVSLPVCPQQLHLCPVINLISSSASLLWHRHCQHPIGTRSRIVPASAQPQITSRRRGQWCRMIQPGSMLLPFLTCMYDGTRANNSPPETYISLKLLTGQDDLPARYFTLTPPREVSIGRSSKSSEKHLIPRFDNGYVNNPVISRDHATVKIAIDLATNVSIAVVSN